MLKMFYNMKLEYNEFVVKICRIKIVKKKKEKNRGDRRAIRKGKADFRNRRLQPNRGIILESFNRTCILSARLKVG